MDVNADGYDDIIASDHPQIGIDLVGTSAFATSDRMTLMNLVRIRTNDSRTIGSGCGRFLRGLERKEPQNERDRVGYHHDMDADDRTFGHYAVGITRALALLLLAAAIVMPGCQQGTSGETPANRKDRSVESPTGERRVLIVTNRQDPSSSRIADHYAERRGIDEDHRLAISVPAEEEISLRNYRNRIERPVRAYLSARGFADEVDFIVLIRGVPIRIREGGYSVDAFLGAMDLDLEPIRDRNPWNFREPTNPYFGRNVPFRKRDFGFYLVTRLDGFTVDDAMRLADASMEGRPDSGSFLLDIDPRRDKSGYALVNRSMREAARILRSKGMEVVLDETDAFIGSDNPLAGYYSWGSNDGSYRSEIYRSIRFLPGAIAETAVSTSARTFRPTVGGQSLIGDLIAAGVTGVKGYVAEPFSVALCPADILFDRYTAGYTLAESFYMAVPFLKWKDIVIGDPLCAPYRE